MRISRLLGLIAWTLGGLVLVAGLVWKVMAVAGGGDFSPPVAGVKLEDEALFSEARSLGLLSGGGPSDALTPPPADWGLARFQNARVVGAPSPTFDETWRRRLDVVTALYGTINGRRVLSEIALSNEARRIVAVRDTVSARDGRQSFWRAETGRGRSLRPLPLVVPGQLTAFAVSAVPGLGSWQVFGDGTDQPLALTLTLAERPAGEVVTVQVFGYLVLSSLPQGWTASALCPPEQMTMTSSCDQFYLTSVVSHPGRELVRFLVVPTATNNQQLREASATRIRENGGSGGEPLWHATPGQERESLAPSEILTADGLPLIDPRSGKATDLAEDLGLIPTLGTGLADARGLAGQVARRSADRGDLVQVTLTIDSQIQRAAREALWGALFQPFAESPDPETGEDGLDPFLDQRRAALEILDPDTGAILASVSWPPTPTGLDRWSIDAYAHLPAEQDPFSPAGYQGAGGDRALGSTFKMVDGLLLSEKAASDPNMARFVAGCAPDARGHLPCLGLSTTTTAVTIPPQRPGKAVHNFISDGGRIEKLGDPLRSWEVARDPLCVNGQRRRMTTIGLAEALRDSINVYFVRGADRIDGERAGAYDHAMRRVRDRYPDPPEFETAGILRDLGFDSPLDLAGVARRYLGPSIGAGRNGLIAEAGEADLLAILDRSTGPGRIDWRLLGAVDTLSRSAVGQQVFGTPLRLAAIAAAVRSGTLPVPGLIASWDGRVLPFSTPQPLGAYDRSALIEGMKRVPETGTAAQAFSRWDGTPAQKAKCAVYGKTGTSDAGVTTDHPRTTAWFVGWAEVEALSALGAPVEGSRSRRPLAFACMVTHGQGKRRTGGGVCGPIVADFLETLAKGEVSLAASTTAQAEMEGTRP